MQLIAFPDHDPFWLFFVWEVTMNAAGALAATAPLWLRPFRPALAALACACGLLIDADHTAYAMLTFNPDALAVAMMRPPTHSLTFATLAAAFGFLLARRRGEGMVVAWVIFAALASHLVRDDSSGFTPILWPTDVSAIPWALYPLGIALLAAVSYALRRYRPGGDRS